VLEEAHTEVVFKLADQFADARHGETELSSDLREALLLDHCQQGTCLLGPGLSTACLILRTIEMARSDYSILLKASPAVHVSLRPRNLSLRHFYRFTLKVTSRDQSLRFWRNAVGLKVLSASDAGGLAPRIAPIDHTMSKGSI
jgi:hypothetical protein